MTTGRFPASPILPVVALLVGAVIALPVTAASPTLADCQLLTDDLERLRCFDELTRQASPEDLNRPQGAVIEKRIQKERDLARRAFAITPHRPNYLLHTYNGDPNNTPYQGINPNNDFEYQEIKYQLSLKIPVWNRMFGKNGDLWIGYTQQSYWQAYDSSESAPFRETNYEPEAGLSFHTDFEILGLHHRLFSVGLSHQSNGRGDMLSRSWNRLWTSFEMERGNFALVLKPWYRFPEDPATDDNPQMQNYAGRGELRLGYKYGDQVFSLMLRNSLRPRDNRSGYEISWSFPFSKRIKGLVQYYNGYGESLIDYDVRTRRIGVGILVEDWL